VQEEYGRRISQSGFLSTRVKREKNEAERSREEGSRKKKHAEEPRDQPLEVKKKGIVIRGTAKRISEKSRWVQPGARAEERKRVPAEP